MKEAFYTSYEELPLFLNTETFAAGYLCRGLQCGGIDDKYNI